MKMPRVSTLIEEVEEDEKFYTPGHIPRTPHYNLRPSEVLKKRLSPSSMKKVCQSSTPGRRKSTRTRHRVLGSLSLRRSKGKLSKRFSLQVSSFEIPSTSVHIKTPTSKIPRVTLNALPSRKPSVAGDIKSTTTISKTPSKIPRMAPPPRLILDTLPYRKVSILTPTKKNTLFVRKSIGKRRQTVRQPLGNRKPLSVRQSLSLRQSSLGDVKGYMLPTLSSQMKVIKKDTLKPVPSTTTTSVPKIKKARSKLYSRI